MSRRYPKPYPALIDSTPFYSYSYSLFQFGWFTRVERDENSLFQHNHRLLQSSWNPSPLRGRVTSFPSFFANNLISCSNLGIMVETREITSDPMIHPAMKMNSWWVSQSILPGRNGLSLSSTQQQQIARHLAKLSILTCLCLARYV